MIYICSSLILIFVPISDSIPKLNLKYVLYSTNCAVENANSELSCHWDNSRSGVTLPGLTSKEIPRILDTCRRRRCAPVILRQYLRCAHLNPSRRRYHAVCLRHVPPTVPDIDDCTRVVSLQSNRYTRHQHGRCLRRNKFQFRV